MKSAKQIELLAPARNLETAQAAIQHGADAIYIGAERFGARAAAGNSAEDIARLVRYAHPFGVKVYVTINTLLRDEEKSEALRLAREMVALGVDALIVQDPMFAQYTHELPLHASTQMDNRTAQIVRLRQEQGYQQTVLARELTIDEIASVHAQVPDMPLEVFVHGAICVCYNGCCYASEHCFGRSANRGECAQFCRLPFNLIDGDGRQVQTQKYLLSMRDMNRTAELEALLDAGVTSLKIEGRLKDVAYVKNVTAWYRKQLDALFARRPEYQRSSLGREEFYFQPDVNRTFNRGYTNYFLHGRTRDLCSFQTPKSIGERVGFIKEIRRDHIVVAGTAVFHNGDGLMAGNVGFRVNRADNNHLYPFRMPQGLRDGMVLYRNQDEAMEHVLAGKTAERKLLLNWLLQDTPSGFRLTATVPQKDDSAVRTASMEFPLQHEEARSDQADGIRQVLSKLGDTIYEAGRVDLQLDGNWFIPRSSLADWRRQVVDSLQTNVWHEETKQGMEDVNSSGADFVPYTQSPIPSRNENIPLMTCRYCIRHYLGACLREGGAQQLPEPLWLEMGDGRRFRLRFDCGECRMRVEVDETRKQ